MKTPAPGKYCIIDTAGPFKPFSYSLIPTESVLQRAHSILVPEINWHVEPQPHRDSSVIPHILMTSQMRLAIQRAGYIYIIFVNNIVFYCGLIHIIQAYQSLPRGGFGDGSVFSFVSALSPSATLSPPPAPKSCATDV